ncbi:uncharacterized protein LOC125209588 [Salvia hispanica]|uniref:uncharacterized protein LOC125209588 n=1 Tax=Salvia hispanica TaxID=49212 RepID=UPI002008F932|nr:uncharacterized protein LOC125209588 [Salvia hispanica]
MAKGGQIELFVEHSAITQQNSHHVISYDVGTSTRAQVASFAATQDFDVGGVRLGDIDNCDVVDDIIGPDKADFLDPPSPYDSEDVNIVSTDSDGDPSDDDPVGETAVEEIVDGETTAGRRVVPQFPQRGMNYFRTLPGTYDSFDPKNFEAADPSVHYWSEKDPSKVGLHSKFRTKLELKTAVTFWHLKKIRQYTVAESKGKRWHAVCNYPQGNPEDKSLPKYLWECRATLRKHDEHWQIRVFTTAHTCMGDRNYDGHANLGSSMIALSVRHQIENDHAYKVKAIVADIENRFHVKVSYKKAWYARRTAIELVYGGWEWSFKVLPSYLNEMQRQNPGTIVEWLHDDRLSRGMNKVFKYVFWAFGPAVEAFQLCKPVLTVDGTHLCGRCRGFV